MRRPEFQGILTQAGLALLAVPLMVASATAQNTFPATGNAGIGTTSPTEPLTILDSNPYILISNGAAGGGTKWGGMIEGYSVSGVGGFLGLGVYNLGYTQAITINQNGQVGIGTTAPQATFHVSDAGSTALDWLAVLNNTNNSAASGYGVGLRLQNSTINGSSNEPNKWAGVAAVANGAYSNNTDLAFYTGNFNSASNTTSPPSERVRIQSTTGHVGIGTTNPQYPLSVNGTIQAKEVLVNTGWADYVFEPNYRVKPLIEVAAYIKANHHLPDIPSQAEVEEKGISLGDMESKLLAKIEELTLQMIQLNETNEMLQKRLALVEGR